MSKNATSVSLKREELVKLRDLHRVAWGYNDNKTADKLERAIARIDSQKEDKP